MERNDDRFDAGARGESADRVLVERAVRGDASSQSLLLVRLHGLALFVARLNRLHGSVLSDHELADVVQDIYCNLWRRLPTFHGRCSFESWAFAFARRQYQGAVRRRFAKPRPLGDSVLDLPDRPALPEDAPEDLTGTLSVLGALDPLDASFVRERILEGRSFGTIAREARLTTSMVKSRFYRSVLRLRGLLRLRRLWDALRARE